MKLIHIIPFCFVFLIIFADESSDSIWVIWFVVSDKNDKDIFPVPPPLQQSKWVD